MDLLQQVLELLRVLAPLRLVDGADLVVDVLRILADAHLLKRLHRLLLGEALEGVGES